MSLLELAVQHTKSRRVEIGGKVLITQIIQLMV